MSDTHFSVAAKLQLRHGLLTQVLAAKGWSQRDLARYLGVPWQAVHAWMKFQRRAPTDPEVLRKLMELTGCPDDEIFPPAIYARPAKERPRSTQTILRDVPLETLLPAPRPRLPRAPSAEDVYVEQERATGVEQALDLLSPRQADVVAKRFGLRGEAPQTLEAVGRHYGVSRACIEQIERQALHKLQHGRASQRLLRPLLTGEILPPSRRHFRHPPAVVAPLLAPPPPKPPRARPAPRLEQAESAPPWRLPPHQIMRLPAVTVPIAAALEVKPVVRVPDDCEEMEHNRLGSDAMCLSFRPSRRGLLACTCGAVRLLW